MTLVVPDTSVWARRRQPNVRDALDGALQEDAVAVVQPVVLELLRAARDEEELAGLAWELDQLHQIGIGASTARRSRVVQRTLAARGYHRGPSAVDLLAAAAAEEAGAELWHCDRHFELIGDVTGQPMRRVGE